MTIHLERRKAVMARSRRLGHCVCNPKQGCPCDMLVRFNVCPCAGERPPPAPGPVALTRHVRKAGCASKIGQADLQRIIGALPEVTDPNVLIGTAAGDDAGVYRLEGGTCLVQTVDVFTPCVDDPYLFGRIAAANSVSDVYAMGGRPITALSIIGFPIEDLDSRAMQAMLEGGMAALAEAHCSLIGGHSINDTEIKFGFAVTGLVDAAAVVARDRARAGDALVLTKPLGTGMVSFAAQIGRVTPEALAEVGASMAALNRDAAELMVAHGAHACTDVTGFALAGHLVEMARRSGVTAVIDLAAVPVFHAAAECLREGILGGAIERNQDYAGAWVDLPGGADLTSVPILYDPQTSGGLLIALPPDRVEAFVAAMRARGHASTAVIGAFVEQASGAGGGRVRVTGTELVHLVGMRGQVRPAGSGTAPPAGPSPVTLSAAPCCENPPWESDGAGDGEEDVEAARTPEAAPAADRQESAMDADALFSEFMKQANAPGLLDARTKKLIAVALSLARHCDPCLKSHLKSAQAMGISRAELDEAARLAVEFCGCPALMFYRETCMKLKL